MPRMRFAISIPQFYGDGEFDPAAFRAYLGRVEQLGFESAWTQENVLTTSAQLGPIETMTYAAACTQRLRLGCVVLVTTLHSPAHLAKSLSTLDQLSGGRLEIGVGTGGKARPFAAFGISQDRYIARFTEGLALMKALWTQPTVTFDGEFWQLKDAAMEPKPAQKPYPPLWFGANASRLCGALSGSVTGSSAQARRRPRGSPGRCRWCGRRWLRLAAIRPDSPSPSGSTSAWTTTPAVAGNG